MVGTAPHTISSVAGRQLPTHSTASNCSRGTTGGAADSTHTFGNINDSMLASHNIGYSISTVVEPLRCFIITDPTSGRLLDHHRQRLLLLALVAVAATTVVVTRVEAAVAHPPHLA